TTSCHEPAIRVVARFRFSREFLKRAISRNNESLNGLSELRNVSDDKRFFTQCDTELAPILTPTAPAASISSPSVTVSPPSSAGRRGFRDIYPQLPRPGRRVRDHLPA